MREHLMWQFDELPDSDIREIVKALCNHLGVSPVRTTDTHQGRKHGIKEIALEDAEGNLTGQV